MITASRGAVTPRAAGGLPPPIPSQAGADQILLKANGYGPNAPPAVTANPAVTGTGAVGNTLTCSTGTWTNQPYAYAYQWQRGATAIGTGASTYVIAAGDSGGSITCVVTATNAAGATVAPPSNATAVP
jgi:hypothetical protein